MLLPIQALQVRFHKLGLRLSGTQPAFLIWDCHHGDIFVLKATGLATETWSGESSRSVISGVLELRPPEEMLSRLETFAARHQLRVELWSPPPAELVLPLVLAACHVPERKLFLFSETSALTVRSVADGKIRWEVQGEFQSRSLISQETDLVLHMARSQAASLASFLVSGLGGVL